MRRCVSPLLLVVIACFALTAPASASTWSAVTGATGSSAEVGSVRTADGGLHVVWARATPGSTANTEDVVHADIGGPGLVSRESIIASGFAGVGNPAIVALPGGGLQVFFGAIQCTSAGCATGLFSSSSSNGGASWTRPVALFDADQVYGSDLNAIATPDGTPFQTWWHTTGVTVHRGTDPTSPDYDFQGAMNAGCCGDESNLAADAAGNVQLAWDSNATGFVGVWSRSVDPATGAPAGSPALMPGSVVTVDGAPQHDAMTSRTPIVAMPGQPGSFYVAYPGPDLTKVLLWHVGSPTAVTVVDEPGNHSHVALAADSSGRLWVFWTHATNGSDQVFARRVSASGPEPTVDLGAPAGAQSILALDGSVSPSGDPDVLALATLPDGTAGTFYTRGAQTAAVPPPVLGKSFNGKAVSGVIYVKLPKGAVPAGFARDLGLTAAGKGNGFVALSQARQLPTGTTVDARRGTLQLTAATARSGKTESGVFFKGLFKVTQASSGLNKGMTTLSLVEGAFRGAPSFASCRVHGKRRAGAARLSPRVLQTLRARAHGRFRTRGRFSAGTVRGTDWGTKDRCDGTLTLVRRGTVLVHDFARRRTIAVHAGHTYLARATKPVY